jgi:hypothetical protein
MATGKAQAFRFIAMGRVARERLKDALQKMRGMSLSQENKGPLSLMWSPDMKERRLLSFARVREACPLDYVPRFELRRAGRCARALRAENLLAA